MCSSNGVSSVASISSDPPGAVRATLPGCTRPRSHVTFHCPNQPSGSGRSSCAFHRLLSSQSSRCISPRGCRAQAARSGDPLAAYLGHGVSHRLAIWRAGTISDVRYDLSLDVTAPDSAIGHVAVHFRRSGNSDVILDWRGRRLTRIMSNGRSLPRERGQRGPHSHSSQPDRGRRECGRALVRVRHRAERREHHPHPRPDRWQRLPLHAARAGRRQPALPLLRPARPEGTRDVHARRRPRAGRPSRTDPSPAPTAAPATSRDTSPKRVRSRRISSRSPPALGNASPRW